MQAMIFAAGLGTRLRPITDTKPKALVSVGGKTLLERVITNLKAAGATRIVVNVHHFAQQIVDYLKENDNFGADIRISDESACLLETGGGIKHARELFRDDEPILIHNVDILSNVDLADFYQKTVNEDALLLVSERKTKRYLMFSDEMLLRGWTNIETKEIRSPFSPNELKSMSLYAFAGIHVLSPRLFPMMDQFPEKFSIIDFYLKLCKEKQIKGFVKDDLRLIDVGKQDTLAAAEQLFKNELG